LSLDTVQVVFRLFGSAGANLMHHEMSGNNGFCLVHIRCKLVLSVLC
jgi:hypothetical protein